MKIFEIVQGSRSDLTFLGIMLFYFTSCTTTPVNKYRGASVMVPPNMTTVSTGLHPGEVQEVFREELYQIRFCYEAALKSNPKAEGKVEVQFNISPDGNVGSARVKSSTVESLKMTDCIIKVIAKLRFPKTEDVKTVQVMYPFYFQFDWDPSCQKDGIPFSCNWDSE